MEIEFYKYHGAGNDFIILDNRKLDLKLSVEQLAHLCHRRFGIGADGLMMIENHDKYDFKMTYYNSDGKEGTMCGNGGRCLVAFAKKLGLFSEKTIFTAIDGLHEAFLLHYDEDQAQVRLKMSDVSDFQQNENEYILDTGSLHLVRFVENIDNIDVYTLGKQIRNEDRFQPKGINVNFVQPDADNIKIRTYERGVEDETLACGTGATAAAIASFLHSSENKTSFNLQASGGKLSVKFKPTEEGFEEIWLEGPTQLVFTGKTNI
jgi:diaminopimelate epimerase